MNSTTLPLPALAEADGVFFLTLTRSRETIATAIERLIDMLDDADDWDEREEENEHFCECLAHEGDGECDDEPSLGWGQPSSTSWRDYSRHDGIEGQPRLSRGMTDCEGDEHDGREPDHDAELQVWTEAINQDEPTSRVGDGWCRGEDAEPDLGWGNNNGAGWMGCATDDREGDDEREDDPAEYGVADIDGLCEIGCWYGGELAV